VLIDALLGYIAGQRAAGYEPAHVVLHPLAYTRLIREEGQRLTMVALTREDVVMIDGCRIVKGRMAAYCRNCGAPIEPEVCSYCKTPSGFAKFEGVPC
jgi:hypothetical protein